MSGRKFEKKKGIPGTPIRVLRNLFSLDQINHGMLAHTTYSSIIGMVETYEKI